MKRAIAGKGRRGAPPLPRQRMALRVVQVTLVALAVALLRLAFDSNGTQEKIGLALAAFASLGFVVWMGVRTVRAPRPPVDSGGSQLLARTGRTDGPLLPPRPPSID